VGVTTRIVFPVIRLILLPATVAVRIKVIDAIRY
jgi:hypothetical protein